MASGEKRSSSGPSGAPAAARGAIPSWASRARAAGEPGSGSLVSGVGGAGFGAASGEGVGAGKAAATGVGSGAGLLVARVVVHVYPGSSKAASEPRLTLFFGRRGKPVLKPRLMPLRVAQAVALQLQARRVGTVSVL